MLSIAPRSSVMRDLTTWAGTAFWGIAAYLLFATVLSVLTWKNATWGGPLPGFFLVGLLAMVAYSALGFAAGSWIPSRFTAPLIAVGIFIWEFALSSVSTKPDLELLSVASVLFGSSNRDVFEAVPQVALQQSLWFLGLGGTALAAIALKNALSNKLVWVSLLGAVAVAIVGLSSSVAAASQLQGPASTKLVPFEPVCENGKITVCVHPAYEKLLPEIARTINEAAAPLSGIPGVPDRALQSGSTYSPRGGDSADSFTFGTYYLTSGDTASFEQEAVWGLVRNESLLLEGSGAQAKPSQEDTRKCGTKTGEGAIPTFAAQDVVGRWLLRRAGGSPEGFAQNGFFVAGSMPLAECPNIGKLTERFAKLDPAKRKSWLEKNFAGLRAGKVALKDLP